MIYLTVLELSLQIKYSEQSIYNLIYTGTFVEGLHYFKPTPKKILFKWQAIVNWIENNEGETTKEAIISTPPEIGSTKPSGNIIVSTITI